MVALTLQGPLSCHPRRHSLLVQQRPEGVHWRPMASSKESAPEDLGVIPLGQAILRRL